MITNLFIIFCITLVILIYIFINIYIRFINNVTLYKYKIDSFIFNIIIISIYISTFIILFYISRLYNLGKLLDLKILYKDATTIWTTFTTPLPLIAKFFLITCYILLLILLLLLFSLINKKIMLEIFKLYLFTILDPSKYSRGYEIQRFCFKFHKNDLVTHSLIKMEKYLLHLYFTRQNKRMPMFYAEIPWYLNPMYKLSNSKYYSLFVQTTPMFVIIYDCIFNNFIITHVYYFLLFYTPLILLKKITFTVSKTYDSMAHILWRIYYDKTPDIIFIANKEEKELIDISLKANVGYIPGLALSMVGFFLEKTITYHLKDQENNIYWNFDGNYLRVINNKIYEIIEDDEGNETYKETHKYVIL